MPPIHINRRRFLGCSAAAGWALSQGRPVEAVDPSSPVRIGVVGLGNRGTSLLRTLLDLPDAEIVALADADDKNRTRGGGIVEKAKGLRPDCLDGIDAMLARDDIEALVVALPCDLHASTYRSTLRAGKHLYGEKPLALTLEECDAIEAEATSAPSLIVHVGHQRRSNPLYQDGVARLRRGDLGELIEATAAWVSSNGPVNGHDNWLASRERSGDWMVEQGVHVWDLLHWIAGGPPTRAFGMGRRDLFTAAQPRRDVTDHYSVQLEWAGGFRATFQQSWAAPADDAFTGSSMRVVGRGGGLDFSTGSVTYRDRSRPRVTMPPARQVDTKLALASFLAAVRLPEPVAPPISLAEAREATLTGLLVRKAVDEGRVVTLDEILAARA
ncbi:Gfo/Idh/MocA family oxidoreductase [Isosphaeraceae bacterium EP7]